MFHHACVRHAGSLLYDPFAEIVVLGAGAIGLALADELSRRGKSVTVVDRDRLIATERDGCSVDTPFRSATSWAAAGILPPANLDAATDPIERLRGLSHRLFPEWAARLKSVSGIDPLLARCGGWYLADTPGEAAAMVGMLSFWRELSIECHEVGLAEFAEREPALATWAGHNAAKGRAWWVPDEYQICPPLYLQALLESCRRAGVQILDQTRATGIEEDASGVTIAVENRQQRGHLHAHQVVVCGGVWSGLIADRLRLAHSLVPVRGQVLLLKTERPLMRSVINLGQRYFVPRPDGATLVGSCEEEVGWQHGTTPLALDEFRRLVDEVCPQLASARQMAAWSGLRPLTFDGFPMLGKLPLSRSIYVAAGHFRSGIHLSPATAVCMADLVDAGSPPIDLTAFGVGKQQMEHPGFHS